MIVHEINLDGMVGPTHHYGGYAYGNLASMDHRKDPSNPKAAALQGLQKMKMVADLGIPQAVLPPRMRPSLATLRELGFSGTDAQIFSQAAQSSPQLVRELSSSASMWAANCATITPSTDTADGKVHITPANLQTQFHRSIESEEAFRLFNLLFPDKNHFTIHPPLPHGGKLGDEGAANHTRFCTEYGNEGTHLFVYGRSAFDPTIQKFPSRQALEASEAIARTHLLKPQKVIFAQQNPEVIDQGVFHNDVISVGNRTSFLYHEKAFTDTERIIASLSQMCSLQPIRVTQEMLTVEEVVKSYFFNSQIVTLSNGEDLLIAPRECETLNLDWLPLRKTFVDVRESMWGGGGPACLRIRCILNETERKHVHPHIFLNDALYMRLVHWVEKYYRDRLEWNDLLDPSLLQEVLTALDDLSQILHLNNFYSI